MLRKSVAIAFSSVSVWTALEGVANAATLFDNSNITTTSFYKTGGSTVSVVPNGYNTYGFSVDSMNAAAEAADDFTLTAASSISGIAFDAYSSSTSASTSPFKGATLTIYSAQPGTAGALPLYTSTTLASSTFTGVYRVGYYGPTSTSRPVFSNTMAFSNTVLAAGTYWAAWDVTSATTAGNMDIGSPPVMNPDDSVPQGNAIVSSDGGLSWMPAADTGVSAPAGNNYALPLTVTGTAVPEPTTASLIILGVVGLATRRRARRGQ